MNLGLNFGLAHFRLSAVFGGPGGHRKVREAARKNINPFVSRSDFMVPSTVMSKNKVNDQRINDYFNMSETLTIAKPETADDL